MVTTYIPKTNFFAPTRIQTIAKKVLKDCDIDRERALETFQYFKHMVDSDPSDDKSKSEMIKALELSMSSNDKKVKVLDMMLKMTQTELKEKSKESKPGQLLFEDINTSQLRG